MRISNFWGVGDILCLSFRKSLSLPWEASNSQWGILCWLQNSAYSVGFWQHPPTRPFFTTQLKSRNGMLVMLSCNPHWSIDTRIWYVTHGGKQVDCRYANIANSIHLWKNSICCWLLSLFGSWWFGCFRCTSPFHLSVHDGSCSACGLFSCCTIH